MDNCSSPNPIHPYPEEHWAAVRPSPTCPEKHWPAALADCALPPPLLLLLLLTMTMMLEPGPTRFDGGLELTSGRAHMQVHARVCAAGGQQQPGRVGCGMETRAWD
eukprot:1161623-Pelagomonas_calceolata.AAC.7